MVLPLYETGIQMLPRPPRSILSIGSEATRAVLPNFTSVQQLSEFTNRTMNWHLQTPHIYAQAVFCCSFIILLILVIGSIMFKRIYEGRFWLIRVIRSTGLILVPNPVIAFLFLAGVCLSTFTPFFLVAIRQYVLHTAPPRNVILWFPLPWLAFSYGLIWAAWGTHFATSSPLLSTVEEESKLHPIRLFFRRASVINTLCLLIPITLTGAIVGPAVIANRQFERALTMERAWQVEYAEEVEFSQAMVQQSQEIWYQVIRSCKSSTVVYSLWTAFSFAMSISYTYISVKLIIAVHRDLARAEEVEAPQLEAVQPAVPIGPSSKASKIVADALQANQMPGPRGFRRETLLTSSFQIRSALHHNLPMTGCENFAFNETASPDDNRRKNLQEALFQIYIQLLGIAPAAAVSGVIAFAFVLTLYSGIEQPTPDGGNRLEHHVGGIWLALLYLVCAAGALNLLPVAFKAYENSINSAKAASANRQAGAPITFMDVTLGAAHIKKSFFEPPNAPSLAMKPPASPAKKLSRMDLRAAATSPVDSDEDQYSWDDGGGPSYSSSNSWSSPSSATKLLW